jgi:hypothetical protein
MVNDKQIKDTNVVINKNQGKPVSQWSKTDIKILIKPDKLKEDSVMRSDKVKKIWFD